ncbi:glycosyltransferase family 2 protein [Flagellimonas allohymeniacidonis]|uniref:Glycosyltransferase family 2 protein n=1 Tax=Flagellimonas allohymeniacidonis TaxID=2517819 RepID=A0A4Q8QF60_9FLAO|nr:glycosyltransferase family 2 protein [Allomuricauda hymeniacidonis]TAI47153.1 glycosyltransferase family 2 protein [Allomuricauda hymeniacidonis]
MAKPLVSIITVNYNESQVTLELLESIRELSYPNIEVIVVDNASPNDNPDCIKERFPEVKLIKSPKNLGFAGGNNLGVKQAKGGYLLFINNDTIVPKDFVEPLVKTLEKDESIGMVSPKIKFHWDSTLIQYAGYTAMNKWTIRNNSIGYHQKDNGDFDTPKETQSIHGAAMMVPTRVVQEVGMMTEIYFLYYEEHDWAEMIKRAGYKIYYQPKSFILHKESVSTGKFSPLKTYYISRNRILFARRNFKALELLVSLIFQCCVSIPKNSLKFLIRREFEHFKALWKAISWNLVHKAA